MNRFLALATTLPISVGFTPLVSATEVSPSPIGVPTLSQNTRPDSAITFTQRGESLPKKATRPLVIAIPATPTTTPEATTLPIPSASATATPVKTLIPLPAIKTGVTSPSPASTPANSPVLSAQAKSALEIEMRLPVYVVKKTATKLASPVTLTPSEPESKQAQPVRAVIAAQPTTEKGLDVEDRKIAEKAPAKPSTPTRLASREARAQQLLLARLDADLAKAERNLQRSETRLSEGQRQLGNINNIIKSAMMGLGDEGKGLHPFVRVAQRYLGTPYVWGGESARGFDCSGFIMRVMRDLGYKALPHSAAEQFRYGTPIAKPLLKAGDIVFFANTYKRGISHVGIYLGRGRFIHAANSKDGTIVSDLNSAKWTAHYAGARRLVSQ
jgi:cell wall-associated NlpC family hydrolase